MSFKSAELPPLEKVSSIPTEEEAGEHTPLTKSEKRRSKSWDTTPIPKLKKSRSQSLNQNELKSLTSSEEEAKKPPKPIVRKRSYILYRKSIVDRLFAPTHPEKNIQDTDPVVVYSGHTGAINCLCPYTNKQKDEIRLYTASNDKTIREWTIEKGGCTKVFEGHTNRVIGIIIDRAVEGDVMYSCSHDNTLKAWDTETGECLRTFEGHTDQVTCFGVFDDLLYSGSLDKTIRIWNKATGELRATFQGHTDAISAIQVIHLPSSKSGTLYSTSIDNTLRTWYLTPDTVADTKESTITFSGHTDWIWCIQVVDNRIYTGSKDTTIRQWDLTGNCLSVFEGHSHSVFRLFVYKEKLYSASWDGTIRIWDIKTKKCESILEGHYSKIQALTLDSEAEVIYSGAVDGSIRAWSLQGKLLRVYASHSEAVNFLWEPSKYGLLISASVDKSIKLWLPTNCYGRTIQIDLPVNPIPSEDSGEISEETKEDDNVLKVNEKKKKKQESNVTNNGNIFIQ